MTELDTLYRRLGGEATIDELVERLYRRVLADVELAPFFKQTDMAVLKNHQRSFLKQALGGPAHYSGKSMREAHASRQIREPHFFRLMDHFINALNEMSIDEELIGQVIDRLEPMIGDIVEEPE